VIENFKTGGLAKFGLYYASLSKDNPRLVYCSVTGFGQDGPYQHRAGYDLLVQGMGGIMDLTGQPDGEPMRGGVAFADVMTGIYSAVAITAALNERNATGKGSYIDMALLDTQVAVLANQASSYLVSGKAPKRMGNAHPAVVPYQVFPVSDGHAIIACGNDSQFARLIALLGAPELAQDERYRTNAGRVVNRGTLIPRMFEMTAKISRADLLAKLEAAGVPGGPINTLEDVFADPQVLARKLRIDLPSTFAKGGSIPGVRAPITINGVRMHADRAPPVLGQHTAEVLREIGEA
jgi:crotonobetainyl-CoA:carnitine CoA-transferase CaiB-like acyl-CoA transferase